MRGRDDGSANRSGTILQPTRCLPLKGKDRYGRVPVITPSLPFGIGFHAAGGLLAANCYVPQRFIRRWSWEIFWMTQAAWCWLLWPAIGAMATIPNLPAVLTHAPREAMLL